MRTRLYTMISNLYLCHLKNKILNRVLEFLWQIDRHSIIKVSFSNRNNILLRIRLVQPNIKVLGLVSSVFVKYVRKPTFRTQQPNISVVATKLLLFIDQTKTTSVQTNCFNSLQNIRFMAFIIRRNTKRNTKRPFSLNFIIRLLLVD